MNPVIYILISIAVAAFIGGLTNYFAIKMLFHPRRALYVGRWKLPFTPGLIPKRRDDIANSLGKVVGDYLVTKEGLSALLMNEQFKLGLEGKFEAWLIKWTQDERRLVDIAQSYWTSDQLQSFESRCITILDGAAKEGLAWLWDKQDRASLRLEQLWPDWSEGRKRAVISQLTDVIINILVKQLHTSSFDQLLRQMLEQALKQTGGMLGVLATVFIDEDKLINQARLAIERKLLSMEMKHVAEGLLFEQVSLLEKETVSDTLRKLTGKDGLDGLMPYVDGHLQWEHWIQRLGQLTISELLNESVIAWVKRHKSRIISLPLKFITAQLGTIITTLQLPKLVEQQVSQFPLERLEQIILSVSGREFRAITWLGAVLGAFIGLMQAIMLLLYS